MPSLRSVLLTALAALSLALGVSSSAAAAETTLSIQAAPIDSGDRDLDQRWRVSVINEGPDALNTDSAYVALAANRNDWRTGNPEAFVTAAVADPSRPCQTQNPRPDLPPYEIYCPVNAALPAGGIDSVDISVQMTGPGAYELIGSMRLVGQGHPTTTGGLVQPLQGEGEPCGAAFGTPKKGTDGDDALSGTPGVDLLRGLAGDDVLDGAGAADCLFGDAGNDEVNGGAGGDALVGGPGDDDLDGKDDGDVVSGGDGTDYVVGGAGQDVLLGDAGTDLLSDGLSANVFEAGPQRDFVAARNSIAEAVDCGAGSDYALVDRRDNVTGCEHILAVGKGKTKKGKKKGGKKKGKARRGRRAELAGHKSRGVQGRHQRVVSPADALRIGKEHASWAKWSNGFCGGDLVLDLVGKLKVVRKVAGPLNRARKQAEKGYDGPCEEAKKYAFLANLFYTYYANGFSVLYITYNVHHDRHNNFDLTVRNYVIGHGHQRVRVQVRAAV